MSLPLPPESDPSETPKKMGRFAVFIAVACAFLIFSALTVFFLTSTGDPETYDKIRALDRARKLELLRTRENKELHETAWIDEKSGIARITIDRAMELELKTLREKPIRAAGLVQPQDLSPTLIHPPDPNPELTPHP